MNAHGSTAYSPARPEPLLSIDEVARWLGISRPTVYRMMDDGRLCATRIGERYRFVAADIRELIAEGKELSRGVERAP
jgi:excisionase family DNA binding protein